MGGPTERPVPDDSTPEQSAAHIERATVSQGPNDSPFGVERHGMFGVAGSGDTSGFGGLVREPQPVPDAERPYGGFFDEIFDNLTAAYPQTAQGVSKVVVYRDEMTLHVRREHLIGIVKTLRNDPSLRFELCSSVSGVDYYNPNDAATNRLHAVYHLTSMTYRWRVRLEVAVSVDDPHVPSVTRLYPTADWQEREAWDMFGIIFDGHPALTRVLMPDDWDGHPQRKDYPLGGIPVQYKGATIPPPDERRAYK
jgi:NADH-quinone oxidoreductase subunit C